MTVNAEGTPNAGAAQSAGRATSAGGNDWRVGPDRADAAEPAIETGAETAWRMAATSPEPPGRPAPSGFKPDEPMSLPEDTWSLSDGARGMSGEHRGDDSMETRSVRYGTNGNGNQPGYSSGYGYGYDARSGRRNDNGVSRAQPDPGQMMIDLAARAAQGLRALSPDGPLVTGADLLQRGADGARQFGDRFVTPPTRLAARALRWAGARAMGPDAPRLALDRSRQQAEATRRQVEDALGEARRRSSAAVAARSAGASSLLRSATSYGLSWIQARAVPQLVDALVPRFVETVVPRLIEEALPEVRTRVLPAVIDDLAHDPQLRSLISEQGLKAVDEAAMRASSVPAGEAGGGEAGGGEAGGGEAGGGEAGGGEAGGGEAGGGESGDAELDRGATGRE